MSPHLTHHIGRYFPSGSLGPLTHLSTSLQLGRPLLLICVNPPPADSL